MGYLSTIAAVWAVVVLGVWAGQRRLMYLPMGVVEPPGRMGLRGVEEVTFPTSDGLTLGAWFVRPDPGTPRATIIVFNGNAGNRSYRAPLAAALRRAGYAVLLFDYRGYGGNPGSPTEAGLIEDGRAARAYLAQRGDVDSSRLVYFGESLGTGVAVALAVEHPPAAMVLRSPYVSMLSLARKHYPFIPAGLVLKDRYRSDERIARVRAPILFVAGDRDAIVPLEQTRRLFELANEPKTLEVIPGADHNDSALLDGDRLMAATVEFLRSAVP